MGCFHLYMPVLGLKLPSSIASVTKLRWVLNLKQGFFSSIADPWFKEFRIPCNDSILRASQRLIQSCGTTLNAFTSPNHFTSPNRFSWLFLFFTQMFLLFIFNLTANVIYLK